MKNSISEILAGAANSTEAIAQIYKTLREADAKYSLGFLCRKSGISSRGYLSDVIHGRRRLHPKHTSGICRAFALNGFQSECMALLICVDHAANEAQSSQLKKLELLKQLLQIEDDRPMATRWTFSHFEIYAAFGLFQGRPSRGDLIGYFGVRNEQNVDEALRMLVDDGVVSKDGDCYLANEDVVIFRSSDDGLSHLDFLRMGMAHGSAQVDEWYDEKDLALFQTMILTVRRDQLHDLVPKFRKLMFEEQAKFHATDGDALLHFNVQVFPSGQRP